MGICPTLVRELLYIQDGDLDAFLGQQVHDNLANAVAAARHDNNLLAPDIRVVSPVVRHGAVEPCARGSEHAQSSKLLEDIQGSGVLVGEDIALRRVARKENQRQREGRIQGGEAEEPRNSVGSDTCEV